MGVGEKNRRSDRKLRKYKFREAKAAYQTEDILPIFPHSEKHPKAIPSNIL